MRHPRPLTGSERDMIQAAMGVSHMAGRASARLGYCGGCWGIELVTLALWTFPGFAAQILLRRMHAGAERAGSQCSGQRWG